MNSGCYFGYPRFRTPRTKVEFSVYSCEGLDCREEYEEASFLVLWQSTESFLFPCLFLVLPASDLYLYPVAVARYIPTFMSLPTLYPTRRRPSLPVTYTET
jgi:hypothetical protein